MQYFWSQFQKISGAAVRKSEGFGCVAEQKTVLFVAISKFSQRG
jgi:hypothetical protein